jgi:hypothetical protein
LVRGALVGIDRRPVPIDEPVPRGDLRCGAVTKAPTGDRVIPTNFYLALLFVSLYG